MSLDRGNIITQVNIKAEEVRVALTGGNIITQANIKAGEARVPLTEKFNHTG